MKRAAKYAIPLAAVTAAGFEEPAEAGDLFLKLGDIQGESIHPEHKDEIDVLAWSWGLANSGTTHAGSGGGGGKVSIGDIKIIKSFDAASTELLTAIASGTQFPEATISVNRQDPQGGGELLEFLKISLNNVILTKLSQGSKDSDNGVAETLTLNFAKVTFEYTKYDEFGKSSGTTQSCFDIVTNTKC